jgi:hypothetical protein
MSTCCKITGVRVAGVPRQLGNLVGNILAFHDFAEDCVPVINQAWLQP